MKRAACAGGLLLLCGWLQVRAGLHGAAFSYKGVENGVIVLEPMIAPRVGVVQESGTREFNQAEVLVCSSKERHRNVKDDKGDVSETELVLNCGDRVFVVKGLYFEEF